MVGRDRLLAALARLTHSTKHALRPHHTKQANEIEHPAVNIKGFPTILFFPDGKKDAPIPFEGPR